MKPGKCDGSKISSLSSRIDIRKAAINLAVMGWIGLMLIFELSTWDTIPLITLLGVIACVGMAMRKQWGLFFFEGYVIFTLGYQVLDLIVNFGWTTIIQIVVTASIFLPLIKFFKANNGFEWGNVVRASSDITDVTGNFVRYCRAFLKARCNLNEKQAQILILDPELGSPMDKAKARWAWGDLPAFSDPDTYLLSLNFDAPEMRRINTLLSQFALEYSQRAPRILRYLQSIGHPLGSSSL